LDRVRGGVAAEQIISGFSGRPQGRLRLQ